MMNRSLRLKALAIAGAAALALSLTQVVPAQAARGKAPDNSARFLARQLSAGGHHFSSSFNGTAFPDYGVSLDAVFGLTAVGVGQNEAARTANYVASNATSYVGAGAEKYAGATGKLLTAAAVQGLDPRNVGGLDLVATLQGLMDARGRFNDASQYGNFSNVLSQSFAIIGLKRAGAGVPAKAGSFLLLAQCPNGGFRLDEFAQRCAASKKADPDATSMAIQALVAVPPVGRPWAVSKALNYLKRQQARNGSLQGVGPTATPNTNTTGLAAAAFAAGGRTFAARKARGYLTSLQFGCTFPAALRGAVAYDATRYNEAKRQGNKAMPTEQDQRSTTQAAFGLGVGSFKTLTGHGDLATLPAFKC